MDEVLVRAAGPDDLAAITEISNALLRTTAIEWRETLHTVEEDTRWLEAKQRTGKPVLVAIIDGEVAGWTSYGDFRDVARWPGYRFTVEHTVHVREAHWGTGIGRILMSALIEHARAAGMHTMIAGIDGANDASIRFHERLGFVEVARMPEVGAKHGRWLDLVLLALRLDAREHPPTGG